MFYDIVVDVSIVGSKGVERFLGELAALDESKEEFKKISFNSSLYSNDLYDAFMNFSKQRPEFLQHLSEDWVLRQTSLFLEFLASNASLADIPLKFGSSSIKLMPVLRLFSC